MCLYLWHFLHPRGVSNKDSDSEEALLILSLKRPTFRALRGKHKWNAASVSAFAAVLFSWFASGIERGKKKKKGWCSDGKGCLEGTFIYFTVLLMPTGTCNANWDLLPTAVLVHGGDAASSSGVCYIFCWKFFCSPHVDINCSSAQSALQSWCGKHAVNHLSILPCPGCIRDWSTSQRWPWSLQGVPVGRTVLQIFPFPPKVSKPWRAEVAHWNF